MAARMDNLVKILQEKDQHKEVEFIVVGTDGELVCMDIKDNTKSISELLEMFGHGGGPQGCRNWGSDVIPESRWIDTSREYTCGGKRVTGLRTVLRNSIGEEVTYPVKGTVILREKPMKTEYRCWSLDGRADVVWGTGDNLELKKVDGGAK